VKNSKIEWTDHTFNPWIGCTKVSPGCEHCYAEAMDKRWGNDSWGPRKARRRTSAANWKQPMKWNEEQQERYRDRYAGGSIPDRPRVFCASLADWLDYDVPVQWLAELLALIKETPNLDWLLLSKRPQNWAPRMRSIMRMEISEGPSGIEQCSGAALAALWLNDAAPPNVWIGTTVEDQQRADERIPELLSIPAEVRFLSCEPLLGPVDLKYPAFNGADSFGELEGIHWVICGGESGPRARPMHSNWARSLRDQCAATDVPFFFKQWGEHNEIGNRSGKHAAGRLLDGIEHNEFPNSLKVQGGAK
jgi:protein gp37